VVIIHGKARIEVGASVGMALLVADTNPEDMIGAADHAMYARKQERRG
jgi:PleD family two-component response regulator